jgi:hypothetical protein
MIDGEIEILKMYIVVKWLQRMVGSFGKFVNCSLAHARDALDDSYSIAG